MPKLLDDPTISKIFYVYLAIVIVFTICILFYKKFAFVRLNVIILVLLYLMLIFDYDEFFSKIISKPQLTEDIFANILYAIYFIIFLQIIPIIGIITIISCMLIPLFEIPILFFNINIPVLSNINRQNNTSRNKNFNINM